MDNSLQKYREKRNFDLTSEPSGQHPPTTSDQRRFVIQKHAASRLHYDFRIEIDGVLKSWAVPKGPSTNPSDKRLAMPTEDHPIEYLTFEGVIPEGEYGAGRMIVWDTGQYEYLKEGSLSQALQAGRIEIKLVGQKLQGGFALIRTGKPDEEERWLLIKIKDEWADTEHDILKTAPQSVLSGRTIEEVGQQAAD
ncbi:MAG TPA: DNA polymerase ligase N-terminal domain-containing protein [Aggregatilineaceae bacterium]|nr:DNA polymerase ligase N-terminal domain-containing protein [Aggregatilineaceae bacterium]